MQKKHTGRQFGSIKPFKVIRKFKDDHGVKCAEVEADGWEGPGSYDPDQEGYHPNGQYIRCRWVEKAGSFHNVNGKRYFLKRKPTTCSFESELAKALK